jgi:quercetin dioxygenase-like cupin family protein
MAARTLHNPRTGETIEFLIVSEDSDGKVFSMGYAMAPGAAIADEHNHPFQQMSIAMHEGVLTCTVGGHDRLVGSGQSITIPAGVHHFQ